MGSNLLCCRARSAGQLTKVGDRRHSATEESQEAGHLGGQVFRGFKDNHPGRLGRVADIVADMGCDDSAAGDDGLALRVDVQLTRRDAVSQTEELREPTDL